MGEIVQHGSVLRSQVSSPVTYKRAGDRQGQAGVVWDHRLRNSGRLTSLRQGRAQKPPAHGSAKTCTADLQNCVVMDKDCLSHSIQGKPSQ